MGYNIKMSTRHTLTYVEVSAFFLLVEFCLPTPLTQSLDIDKEVKAGKIFPNKWLVLKFDFSAANRSHIPEVAKQFLGDCINDSIRNFCETYHKYLGYETSERMINLVINVENPISSLNECVRITRGALNTANTLDNTHPLRGVQGVGCNGDCV